MPVRRRVRVALADPVLREALLEQLNQTPGLQGVDGGARPAPGEAEGPPPDAAVVDAEAVEAWPDPACPVIGIGPPAPGRPGLLPLPLRMGDLATRLQGAIRDSRGLGRYRIGGAEFEPGRCRIRGAAGDVHTLTERESDMLLHLCRSGGRQVPRDELLDMVWGYSSLAETHTVETHAWRLRSILAEAGCEGALRTGEAGYRIVPPPVPVPPPPVTSPPGAG